MLFFIKPGTATCVACSTGKETSFIVLISVCIHVQRQRDSSRGRRREKEDIKITKERTPASEEEPTEWETNREGTKAPFVQI